MYTCTGNVVNWMYCLELINFDVFNTSYYLEVEKMVHCWATSRGNRKWPLEVVESHGKVIENFQGKSMGTLVISSVARFSLIRIGLMRESLWVFLDVYEYSIRIFRLSIWFVFLSRSYRWGVTQLELLRVCSEFATVCRHPTHANYVGRHG